MSNNYFTNPIIFLIRIVFEFYLLAIMLRFLFQWIRADFYNPISQFIVRITNPPLIPLRKVIPGVGGVDMAALVLLLTIALIQLFTISLLSGFIPTTLMLFARSIADLIELFLNIYFFSILVQVILSWVAPHQYNPVVALIHQLNDPLMRPLRKIMPQMGGFDFTPMIAIILIQLSKMILLPPLYMIR